MSLAALPRLALADLRERTRQGSFLVTLVAILAAASLGLPAKNAGYATVNLGGWRGIYNSAWVGASTALLASIFLSMIGFYLVKNSIERDRRSNVGEILAGTPLSRFGYLLAKALSNFAVLSLLAAVVMVMSGVMQFFRGEDRVIEPLALFLPFLLMTLPLMALVAALAVFFEATPFLRGSAGNVAWFFVWVLAIVQPSMGSDAMHGGPAPLWSDPTGLGLMVSQMVQGVRVVQPDFDGGSISVGINIAEHHLKTFDWSGLRWSPAILAGRFSWFAWALAVVALAVPMFDRFARSPAPAGGAFSRRKKPAGRAGEPVAPLDSPVAASTPTFSVAALTPMPARRSAPAIGRLVIAELRLMLQGLSRWWYVVAVGLAIAGVAAPAEGSFVLGAIAWIWPLALWSALGCRESMNGTAPLFDSSPGPIGRRLLAQWLAGAIVAILTGVGIGLGALRAGSPGLLVAWLGGAAFVPALALAAGAWSGSRRLFEALYIALWYCGPMNQVASLDYTGQAPGTLASGTPVAFIIATGLLLASAALARRRQLERA